MRLRLRWLGVTALCLASCSAITVETASDSATPLASYGTYAWSTAPPQSDPSRTTVTDEVTARMVELAVDQHLAGAGMRRVSAEEAVVLVTQQLSVVVDQVVNDPYYSATLVERNEEGALKLEFVDKATQKPVWSGTGRCRLRTVSRDIGLTRQEFVSTEEKRAWPVEELVDAILGSVRKPS